MISRIRDSRGKLIFLWVFGAFVLGSGAFGFFSKFYEFVHALGTHDGGEFTIVPVLNYLLMTLGFVCMMGWAVMHGMFRDVEKPKYTMLEREEELDRLEGRDWSH
jgi:hypothetical protein